MPRAATSSRHEIIIANAAAVRPLPPAKRITERTVCPATPVARSNLRQPPAQDDDQADHRDLIHHRNTQQVNGIAGSGQQNEERRDDRDHCRNAEDDRPPLTAGTGSLRFTPKSGQWLRGHDGRGQ